MIVREIIDKFIYPDVQHIQIWADDRNEVVFDGYCGNLSENMKEAEISSIDNIGENNNGVICLNVWSID